MSSYHYRQYSDDDAKRRIDREANAVEKAERLLSIGIIGLILCGIVAGANYALLVTGPDFQFNHAVHGHIENAYWSSDPQTMKNELELAVQGMHDLGLDGNQSAKYFPWEQTPDYSMSWEYAHMQSVIDRCDEFIQWTNEQNGTGSQQMQDVYSQKLNNIRSFISPNDGGSWSDDVAKGAYLIKSCSLQTIWMPSILTVVMAGLFILTVLNFYARSVHNDRFNELGGRWGGEDQ